MTTYTKGQLVRTVYGEIAMIFSLESDNVYSVWIIGQGMTFLHNTKIIEVAE